MVSGSEKNPLPCPVTGPVCALDVEGPAEKILPRLSGPKRAHRVLPVLTWVPSHSRAPQADRAKPMTTGGPGGLQKRKGPLRKP